MCWGLACGFRSRNAFWDYFKDSFKCWQHSPSTLSRNTKTIKYKSIKNTKSRKFADEKCGALFIYWNWYTRGVEFRSNIPRHFALCDWGVVKIPRMYSWNSEMKLNYFENLCFMLKCKLWCETSLECNFYEWWLFTLFGGDLFFAKKKVGCLLKPWRESFALFQSFH